MRKYKNFLQWYYGKGIRDYGTAVRNVMSFLPRFFSFGLLGRTLFAPWHRDISLRSWAGVQPLKSLQRLIWNLFSRFVGLFIRLGTLALGAVCLCAFLIFAVILFVVYFAWPGVAIVSMVFFFAGHWIIGGVLAVMLGVCGGWAYLNYRQFFHRPYAKMDILMLAQQPWFHRVWERFGIAADDVAPEVLSSLDAFESFLRTHEMSLEEAQDVIAWEMEYQRSREEVARPFSQKALDRIHSLGRWWHYGYTPTLNRFSHDLSRNDYSSYGREKLHGHQREMSAIESALQKPGENNVLLVGEPGVGRTFLVHLLAQRVRNGIYRGTVLGEQRILEADLSQAIAKAKDRGRDPEFVAQGYLHEAAHAGNVTLFLKNFEQYFDRHTSHSRDFSYAAMLDEYAPLPHFRMIATTSEEAFQSVLRVHDGMLAHFSVIHVDEMNEEHAIQTLFTHFYDRSRTVFTYQALREIVRDSARYTNTGPLPSRALALAEEVKTYWRGAGGAGWVTPDVVLSYITHKTGIPLGHVTGKEEQQKLLTLEENLAQRVIAQPEAARALAEALRRMRSGIARPHRPAGSFLFLGPTGVGKTEMAKTVAAEYFGGEDKVARIDMSEYQGSGALTKLLGSRSTGEKGSLSEIVATQPYSVLLLDEIEKADASVLDIFLQILDEGFAHNGFGRKLHFTSMVIIATSNAGSRAIAHMVAQGDVKNLQEQVLARVVESGIYRQEFLNRFDDVVVFTPLDVQAMQKVTKLMLAKFAARIAQEQNVVLTFADDVSAKIVEKGYEPKNGARSILRYIDKTLADVLAKKLISGNVLRGDAVHFSASDLL